MRTAIVASLLLLTAALPANAQVSIGISIGAYPSLTVVPGYPVYYAPDIGANFFFYDGYYWVYQDDNWYSSTWYNGPWALVDPMFVPIYVLQVPVRYYRRPPQYFSGWQVDRAPRWNDHWGRAWAERRSDWDRPQRAASVAPAPLPDYQRRYSGKDYPRGDQQRSLQQQYYHYQPHNAVARQDSSRQPDERRSEAAQSSNQDRPSRSFEQSKRDQPRPAPQQGSLVSRQNPQPVQEQQARPGPQQEQERRQRPAPQQEQQRAAVGRESDHADKGRNQDKGKNEEKDRQNDRDR